MSTLSIRRGCQCGGDLRLDSNRDGRAIEICEACGSVRAVPRAIGAAHPIVAANRANLGPSRRGICREPNCGGICRPNAERCAPCAREHDRKYHRERKRTETAAKRGVA